MDAKKTQRGFDLRALAMLRPLTAIEREELMQLESDARAEMRTPRELADPDGPGPLEASRPTLDGGDFLEDEKAKDVKRGAQSIGAAVLGFVKGLVPW